MALSEDTIIQTPYGPKKITDVKVGDEVFDANGDTCHILSIENLGPNKTYRTLLTNGAYVDSSLSLLVKSKNREAINYKVKYLSDIINSGLHKPANNNPGKRYTYSIPICQVDYIQNKKFIIHPYIMGLLLGDGNLNGFTPNLSVENKDESEISFLLEKYLPSFMGTKINKQKGCKVIRLVNYPFSYAPNKNPFKVELARLGLNVHGKNKFIPNEYKLTSIENRIELIRGMMDSDGSCVGKITAQFTNTCERLSDDFLFVAESVGALGNKKRYERTANYKTNSFWVNDVSLKAKFNPFKLQRKASLFDGRKYEACKRVILDNIPLSDKKDLFLIKTDSLDKSLLINRFIPIINSI